MSSSELASSIASFHSTALPSGQPAQLPVMTLASGQRIHTGAMADLLYDIRLYDCLSSDDGALKAEIERDIELMLPAVKAAGLLQLFGVEEWEESTSEGKRFVGRKARELGYQWSGLLWLGMANRRLRNALPRREAM